MITYLRRYFATYFDAELAASRRQLAAQSDQLAAGRRKLADVENRHAQTAAVLAAERDSARHDLQQVTVELAEVRYELEKTTKALGVAEEENRRLWAVCQRDHARVSKERALLDRARAEAEVASVARSDE
jgi:hypothetical protein